VEVVGRLLGRNLDQETADTGSRITDELDIGLSVFLTTSEQKNETLIGSGVWPLLPCHLRLAATVKELWGSAAIFLTNSRLIVWPAERPAVRFGYDVARSEVVGVAALKWILHALFRSIRCFDQVAQVVCARTDGVRTIGNGLCVG